MNALVLCVGQLKESWQKEACAEYLKRLSRYGKFEIKQVPDESEPANSSPALQKQIMDKEGAALLRHIKDTDRVVALCIKGDAPDSVGLSRQFDTWAQSGRRIVLVIGGSLGLSQDVLSRADHRLSFSNLTFPHPLMRVILLEQLYRACKISAGEKYHK